MRTWKRESGWTNPKENNRKKLQDQQVSTQLEQNLDLFKEIMGNAQDLIIREFTIASDDEVKAAVIAVEGLVDRDLVNEQVLANLMLDIRFRGSMDSGDLYQRIEKYGISNMIIKEEW
ncbi:MAG: spore germination protein [Bacillota bacterium]